MPGFSERTRRLADAVRQRLKRPRWWIGILSIVGLFLLQVFAGEWVLAAWNWLWPILRRATLAQVGVVGLLAIVAVVVMLGVVLGLSYWDTRPARAKEKPIPIPEIDPHETHDIATLRAIWVDPGHTTIHATLKLLNMLTDAMVPEAYWRGAVESGSHLLAVKQMELDQCLHLASTCRLSEIHERFNQMYGAYINALRWAVMIHEGHHSTLDEQEYQQQLSRWVDRNRRFYRRLRELNAHPGHSGHLRFVPTGMDEPKAFVDVLLRGTMEPPSVEVDAEELSEAASRPNPSATAETAT